MTLNIIEELIRWDSPLQFFQRWVLEETVVSGINLSKEFKNCHSPGISK